MVKDFYSKNEVINYVWKYSNYHGNLLSYCEDIANKGSGNGFVSLIFLFNVTENIFKDRTKDYDASFFNVIKVLKNQDMITQIEYKFLNNKENSIRKIRNLLAHANLSKYNLSFNEEGRDIKYSFVENETCIKLYELVSNILYNLMLRVVSVNFVDPFEIKLDDKINKLEINIVESTPEEILESKGVDVSIIPNWNSFNEIDKYRFAENSSDKNMISSIMEIAINYLK